ncbi:MAG: GTP cyclohydrolase I [bacterium]|nr:GTP cyclohydrolase I [bacterium]
MAKALDINFEISGTKIFLPFSAICTVTDKEFSGQVIIEYHPNSRVLEYVDIENFVNHVCQKKVTAEELVDQVYREVESSILPKYLKITTDIKHSDAHQPVQVWKEGNIA